jgi:prepilin-type N-terminal cleavage/methylation domain-containing protein
MKKKISGFSLVELLIVMAILGLLAMIAIVALNPQMLVGKANDARRKSDLSKIKKAFEEYYNDKGFYPPSLDVDGWNIDSNCGKVIPGIEKYLKTWPCDPKGQVYVVITNGSWFKVVTNLENKKDKDIPDGWYEDINHTKYTASFRRDLVNYGVSSLNILWYEGDSVPDYCGTICQKFYAGGCNQAPAEGCSLPDECYLGFCSLSECSVSSCH